MPDTDELYITLQKGFVERGYLAAISGIALKVYVALCSFKDWETGNCWPSIASLCEVTGLCRASVITAVRQLEKFGLVKSWKHRKERGRMFKKFYHIEKIKDICPTALDKRHRPTALDKSPRPRNEKGRFVKTESNNNGPLKTNTVGSLESNGDGLSKSNGVGQELISLNYNHRTKITEQGKHGLRPLSCKEKKEKGQNVDTPAADNETKPKKMTPKEEKEAVRELIRTMGEDRTRSYLIKCGRDPRLVDEVSASEGGGQN